MSRRIIISKTAKRKLEKLFDYLIRNWSEKINLILLKN